MEVGQEVTGRTVKEWVGKTPDSRPPPRVRLRVFERHGGICHLSGRKIKTGEPWDCDHVVALINGGENREFNLAPALRDKHRIKTKADVAEKSAVNKTRKAHLSIKSQKRGFRGWRRFNGEQVWNDTNTKASRDD